MEKMTGFKRPLKRKYDHDGKCSNCGGDRDREWSRYCRPCHALYMRLNRPKHSELPDEARQKANCRSYANVYQRRGKITPQPCIICGSDKAEKHHEDYSKPLEITWLCRPCHLKQHNNNKTVPKSG